SSLVIGSALDLDEQVVFVCLQVPVGKSLLVRIVSDEVGRGFDAQSGNGIEDALHVEAGLDLGADGSLAWISVASDGLWLDDLPATAVGFLDDDGGAVFLLQPYRLDVHGT